MSGCSAIFGMQGIVGRTVGDALSGYFGDTTDLKWTGVKHL